MSDTTPKAVYERLKSLLQREPGEQIDDLLSLLCKKNRIQVIKYVLNSR
jgi:hypothetical protein